MTAVSAKTKADAVLETGAERVIGRDELPPQEQFSVVIDVVGDVRFLLYWTLCAPEDAWRRRARSRGR